ncbi:MAG TPA: hypothetical protein DHW02_19290 [Ktedonobacter sp.]|nr:hypothetical protein [Ktedonobacter sp.]
MATTSIYCPSCGAQNTIDADTCFACQHPLHEPVHETLLHNRYRLLDQLGSGGFGAVHRAEDAHEQGKLVAIKQINLAGLTPQQVIEATDGFNREVSLLSTLSHPHLPHIYEHFTDPDHWYLVMDFLEGETLEAYLDKTYMKRGALTPLPLNEVLDIGLQLCTVLDYLHTREPAIIFRDVKPANIMRTPTGTLYLIDFGIARHYKPGKPKDTIPFGSPGYAAPEQYGKAQTSPRSDTYSLGALLHMLLSGDDPVDNPFHFDPLRLYGESMSELTTLIERMVSLDVEQRPENVQEVRDTLQAISDAQNNARILPVVATPPPPPPSHTTVSSGNGLQQMMVQRQQLRKQRQQYWSYNRRKSRRGFVIGTIGIVSALALVGAGLDGLFQLEQDRIGVCSCGAPSYASLFEQAFPLIPVYPTTAQLQNVSWSPDGNSVALAADKNLCVQQVDAAGSPPEITSKITMLYHTASPILALAWQPEIGGIVAFASDKTLNLWSGDWAGTTGFLQDTSSQIEAQREPDASTDEKVVIQSIAWSPDGKHIAFPFARGIQVWDAKTQTHVKNLLFSSTYEANQITSLSWSPDSKYIAAAFSNSFPAVWRISDGTFYENVVQQNTTIVAWSPDNQFLATANGSVVYITKLSYPVITTPQKKEKNIINPFILYMGHSGVVTSVSWSPGGRYIASGSDDTGNNLHVWTPFDVSNGPPNQNQTSFGHPAPGNAYVFSTSINNNGTGVQSLSWSPDGSSMLVGTNNAFIYPLNTQLLG